MRLVNAGKIINTHGIKGELKVRTDLTELFISGSSVIIKTNYEEFSEVIDSVRMHKGNVLVKLKGYENINDVLKFKGFNIFMHSTQGLHLVDDLLNFEVFEGEKLLGIVARVISTKLQDVIVLDTEAMIPHVEEFVKEIDYEKRIIRVALIEGMYHEN